MGRLFFTGDQHLDHDNIIRFSERPFRDLDTMNDTIIHNWNSRVKPDDDVINLGDFSYRARKVRPQVFLNMLNGNKVLVRGNHDKNNGLNIKIESLVVKNGPDKIFCVHNPRMVNIDYEVNFVGHVHQNWKYKKIEWEGLPNKNILINVGVDVWKFYPVEMQEIMAFIAKIKDEPYDVYNLEKFRMMGRRESITEK